MIYTVRAFLMQKIRVVNDMPSWPKHPCAYQGCPVLIDKNKRFCPEHEKQRNREYEKYGRKYEAKKRYNNSWSKISDRYRKEHPLCEICYAEGKAVPAVLVHHKIPISVGGTNRMENLQALCSSCHGKIHASRGDRWH